MHRIHSLALAAGVIAFVGVGAAAGQTPYPQPGQKPTPQTQPQPREKVDVPQKSAENPDSEFAHEAAIGGKREVENAKFAVTKTQNVQLKALANRLIKEHTAANTELAGIMKKKNMTMPADHESMMAKGPEKTGEPRPGAGRPTEPGEPGEPKPDVQKKEEPGTESWRSLTGAAFDRAYADHLVSEHEKTISLFENESTSGSDAQFKAFATKTLPTLKAHLKAAQDLQKRLNTTT